MKKIILTIIIFSLDLILLQGQWETLNEGIGRGSLITIDFINDVGWVTGGKILLKTVDGGENWSINSINEDWGIKMIDFITESVGWAIGKNDDTPVIWKTSNGGSSWSQQLLLYEFESIYAIDENNAFAVGNNIIYKTINGNNWVDVSPNLPWMNYRSMYFQDSLVGVVVGTCNDGTADRGVIVRTT